MSKLRILFICLIAVFAVAGRVEGQPPSQIPITLPINGRLVLGVDTRLLLFDTFSGDIETMETVEPPKTVGNPRIDLTGSKIAFLSGLDVEILEPLDGTGRAATIFPFDSQIGLFSPLDWNPGGTLILGKVSQGEIGGYELRTLDIQSGLTTTLRRYERNTSLIEDPAFQFFQLLDANWNPIQNDWIALQLATFPIGTRTNTGEGQFSTILGVIFNRSTNETLLLNDFLNDSISSATLTIWSTDGRHLLVETINPTGVSALNIVEFFNPGTGWTFNVVKSGLKEISSVQHWLDIQDMVIDQVLDTNTLELTYYIAQIVNGQLLRREFLRIPLVAFSSNPLGNNLRGDWHLTASEDEKRALSCLFDQAMPTRLSIGTRARVNFTDGTPLRLRAEPDFDAAEIMQMPEGTEFDVIGGPACVNAASYYRFWELQLDDGTTGWAAEANSTDTFIEPVH